MTSAEQFRGGADYVSFDTDRVLRPDLQNRVRLLNPTAEKLRIYLPNATGLQPGGPYAILKNVGAAKNSIRIVDFEGGNVGQLAGNNFWAKLFLLSGHDAAGTWKMVTSNGSADFAIASANPGTNGTEATTVAAAATTAAGQTLANKFHIGATQAPDLKTFELGLDGMVPIELPRNLPSKVGADDAARVAGLLTSDAIAATAQDAVNQILGLRLDGESAMGQNGGSIRGVSYTRFIEKEKESAHHVKARAPI